LFALLPVRPRKWWISREQELFYPGGVRASIRYEDSDGVSVDAFASSVAGPYTGTPVYCAAPRRISARKSLCGIEADWPISHEKIASYYSRIEKMIGACENDDLDILPAGLRYLPPLPLRRSETILKRAVAPMGISMISVRGAAHPNFNNRPACHYCGHSWRAVIRTLSRGKSSRITTAWRGPSPSSTGRRKRRRRFARALSSFAAQPSKQRKRLVNRIQGVRFY
jgi:choline dehydrogenase-like flavoprotein